MEVNSVIIQENIEKAKKGDQVAFTFLLDFFWNDPEPELPLCTADDLWQKPSLWKVYKNTGSKKAMRGGIFTDPHSANAFAANIAGSEVREIPSKPVACLYCNCRSICSQYANFVTKGVL